MFRDENAKRQPRQFQKFINKEVFIIRGEKKGFRATLYALSPEDCIIAVHSLPHMNAKRYNVATM
jgi:hypothetical protein